jgi:hypothetical protein
LKVLFCKTGWMQRYAGLDDDELIGGGSFVDDNHFGGEIYNFHESIIGECHGYVVQPGYGINIQRLDARPDDDYCENILVVFIASEPYKKGVKIVGWYKDATVYKNYQEPVEESIRDQEDGTVYNIVAKTKDVFLLPEHKRSFEIYRATKHRCGYGRSNLWYADSGVESQEIVENVIKYIKTCEDSGIDNQITLFNYNIVLKKPFALIRDANVQVGDKYRVTGSDDTVGEFVVVNVIDENMLLRRLDDLSVVVIIWANEYLDGYYIDEGIKCAFSKI